MVIQNLIINLNRLEEKVVESSQKIEEAMSKKTKGRKIHEIQGLTQDDDHTENRSLIKEEQKK